MRTPQEVFDEHLSLRVAGKLEEDLRLNYSENVVVFCVHGLHFGHDGVRCTASKLREALPSSDFTFTTRLVQGDVAYLEWTGKDKDVEVMDGADSFVIRDGKIMAQTIHYTVRGKQSD